MLRPPDRWLDYSFCGKPVADTPFVALKCPLHDGFLQSVPAEKRFGPDDVKSLIPNISMIIDLTFTRKYYDGNVFPKLGVKYIKIPCKGHIIPKKDLLQRFFYVVDEFFSNCKEKSDISLIGVHCTHGVNRTGFFVCSYLICKLGYTFANAVKVFNEARGHDMERPNYLKELEKYEERPLSFTYYRTEIIPATVPVYDRRIKNRVKPRHPNREKYHGGWNERFQTPTMNFEHSGRNIYHPRMNCNFWRPRPFPNCPYRSDVNTYHFNREHRNDHRFIVNNSHVEIPPYRHFSSAKCEYSESRKLTNFIKPKNGY